MASVGVEDVRDVLNLLDSDIADAKVQKMINRAAVTLGLEVSATVDPQNCSDAQKEAVIVLAAVYAVCFLSGGSAVGLNFKVGDLDVTQSSKLPSLDVLQGELSRIIETLKKPYVGRA